MSESLDPLAFRRWLETWPHEVVGVAHSPADCPLACWLSSRGRGTYMVGEQGYYGCAGCGALRLERLPGWAKQFVELVDRAYGYRPVLKAGALSLLDCCLRKVG